MGELESLGVGQRVESTVARERIPFFTQPYPLLPTCFPFLFLDRALLDWALLDMAGARHLLKVRKIPPPWYGH